MALKKKLTKKLSFKRKAKKIIAPKKGTLTTAAAKEKMHVVMHEFKEGTLSSGHGEKKVKSRKQAIAIGLSVARKLEAKKGAKRKKSSRPKAKK